MLKEEPIHPMHESATKSPLEGLDHKLAGLGYEKTKETH